MRFNISQHLPFLSITHVKQNYENYEAGYAEKWVNENFIQSDTSIASIAKQLNINNQQWEFNKQQQTLEKAITKNNFTLRQLTTDVDYLKETLEKVHPGLYWYTNKSTLYNEFESVKSRLSKKNTEAEFFQLLSPLIEIIHCGHTNISPSLVKTEYQKLYQKLFPLGLWINGDSAFVKTAHESISSGSSVLAINGHEIPEIANRIKACIAADGFNVTYKAFLLNKKFPALFANYFPGKDTFDIKIQDLSGQIKNITIVGRTENLEESKSIAEAKLIVFDSLETAMLTIPSFSDGQDFPMFLQKSFAHICSKGIKNLIIDLRNNQGGRDEYGLLLYSYLAREPFRYYKSISVATRDTTVLNRLHFGDVPFNAAIPDYISNIREENSSIFYTAHANLGLHQPQKEVFNGPVYIITNGGTFSTAADFASIAHTNQRAIFIGEEAGGSYYGNSSFGTPTLTLPNSKIRITIPIAKYETAVSKSIQAGHGVMPDYQTNFYSLDVLQNRDKDLELCFNLIRNKKK